MLFDLDESHQIRELNQISQIAARIVRAPICLITKTDSTTTYVVGRFGCELKEYPAKHCRQLFQSGALVPVLITDPSRSRAMKRHPLVQRFPNISSLYIVPFKLHDPYEFGCVVLIDAPQEVNQKTDRAAMLADVARLAGSHLERLTRAEAQHFRDERHEAARLTELAQAYADIADPCIVFDRSLQIVGANNKVLDLLDVDIAEVLGKSPGDLARSSGPAFNDIARTAVRSGRPQISDIEFEREGKSFGIFCVPISTDPDPRFFLMVAQRRRDLDHASSKRKSRRSPRRLDPTQAIRSAPGMAEADPQLEVSSKFLMDTLVHKQALHQRNDVSYVSLRAWRKPLKQYQLLALQSLKSISPSTMADAIAEEITDSARRIFGADGLRNVVPVPCCSSARTDCLSVHIASRVAHQLNLKFSDVLKCVGEPGKSHPKKSARLKPFKLRSAIEGATLVIDDVATSGRHMELAFDALRRPGTTVTGMVWIGPN